MLQSYYQKSVEEMKRSLDLCGSLYPIGLQSVPDDFFLAEGLTRSDAIDLICTIICEESGLNIDCRIF